MSRATVLSLFFLLLVAVMILASLQGIRQATCEVCIEWNGQEACRTGEGRTEEDARRTATESACAVLASGMTERIRCASSPPTKLECR